MNLQNPAALMWLIPLGAALLLLYMLRMKRRELRVPATFLWPDKVEEIRANAPFRRLIFSWLLVLQLLALACLVFALTRPQQRQTGLAGAVTVFVLDASASMGATDVRPSRFEHAKTIIGQALRAASPGDRIALIEAGPSTRVVFPLQTEPGRRVANVQALESSDAEVDVSEGLRLASALIGTQAGGRIVLISDGVAPPIHDFAPGTANFAFYSVGNDDGNLAISALGVSETAKGRAAYLEVSNPSGKRMRSAVSVFIDGKLVDSQRVDVASGKSWAKTFPVPRDAKLVRAELDGRDALDADDVAHALVQPGSSLRVLLVGPSDPFLERALALDPRVTLDQAARVPEAERGTGPGAYDIVVFNGTPEIPVRARGILNFGAQRSPIATALGPTERPTPRLESDVPLMEGVNLSSVAIARAERIRPSRGAEVVSESSAGPLIVKAPGRVVVGFVPLASDFPLSPAFPIFIANVLDFLGGAAGSEALVVRPGVPFTVPAVRTATLTPPGGALRRIEPRDGVATMREVRSAGVYQLNIDGKKRTVYADLRSATESRIAPQEMLDTGDGQTRAVRAPERFADFFKPLLLLGLALLALEWWVFARKS